MNGFKTRTHNLDRTLRRTSRPAESRTSVDIADVTPRMIEDAIKRAHHLRSAYQLELLRSLFRRIKTRASKATTGFAGALADSHNDIVRSGLSDQDLARRGGKRDSLAPGIEFGAANANAR